jgi:diguanylate cyclase (GGDEF)-like protein
MNLSISRALVLVYAVIVVVSFAAIGLVNSWVRERSVSIMAANESRRNAELIFQNLYSVMRKDWSKREITDLISRMNQSIPDIHISVYRSAQVAEAFGEIEFDRQIRETDPVITAVMADGKEHLITGDETLRYIFPILVEAECLACHFNVDIGSVNGVIDIRVPTNRLRVPLEFTLNSITWAFTMVIGVVFVLVLLKMRYLVVRPIVELARHIDRIVESGDLGRRVTGRSFQWMSEVRSLAANFNRLLAELEQTQATLVQLSTTDPLTGLTNRRRFAEALATELERSQRYDHAFGLIMIDLNGFKPINDTRGHAAGDLILQGVAESLKDAVRSSDMVARLGGDEFIVLSPETSHDGATALAQKLKEAVTRLQVQDGDDFVSVGASVGVAVYPDDGKDSDALLERADAAMYADKAAGKQSGAAADLSAESPSNG